MVPLASQMAPSGTHMTSICHTWLQHGAHGSCMVPSQWMWLPYGTICIKYGAPSPYTVHTALLWASYVTCGSHIVPSDSHSVPAAPFGACGSHNGIYDSCTVPSSFQMVESGSDMAPIQCTWLPYGTHTSQMAPSASHMAPIQARGSDTSTQLPLL
jgi:hypothetical protein